MGFYLVMKNNLKRQFKNKMTYALIIVIPIVIFGMISIVQHFEKKEVRVGIIGADNSQLVTVEKILASDNISWEIVTENVNAKYIMGDYHYLVDFSEETKAIATLTEADNIATNYLEKATDDKASARKNLAMIISTYLIIATVYATKLIRDKQEGTVERFKTSGLGTIQYIGGYMASTFIIVLLHIEIIMMLFRKMLGFNYAMMILIGVGITIIAAIYGVLHACIYKTEMTANMMASSMAVIMSVIYMSVM